MSTDLLSCRLKKFGFKFQGRPYRYVWNVNTKSLTAVPKLSKVELFVDDTWTIRFLWRKPNSYTVYICLGLRMGILSNVRTLSFSVHPLVHTMFRLRPSTSSKRILIQQITLTYFPISINGGSLEQYSVWGNIRSPRR